MYSYMYEDDICLKNRQNSVFDYLNNEDMSYHLKSTYKNIKNENLSDFLTFQKKDRENYIQKTIRKDKDVKKWFLKDILLNIYSDAVLDKTMAILTSISSIESFAIEFKKESLPTIEDDLTINIYLSEKVGKEEKMDIWKNISSKSVNIMDEITNNSEDFDKLLEKTTITLKNCSDLYDIRSR